MLKGNILKIYPELLDSIVTLADVGAAGGIDARWNIFGQHIRVIGFEPDKREFEKLKSDDSVIWYNKALHCDDKTHQLNLTKWQTNTSFLRPNMNIIDKLYTDKSNFDVVSTISIQCDRLDDIAAKEGLNIDVIKLDTQGTELFILQGAERCLDNDLFAIESEVEFIELYEGQPLFTDIDRFLRAKDYVLMDYGNVTFLKGKHTFGRGGNKGFMVAADALYFKSIDSICEILGDNSKQKFASIIMCCLAYGYSDYAIEICCKVKLLKLIPDIYLDELINKLSKTGHIAQFVPKFWGKDKLAMIFKGLGSILTRTEDVCRVNRLGNQIELYKW